MEFRVYAHGTFWGIYEAATADDAIRAAADEHGTVDVGQDRAGTDGMTALPAGKSDLVAEFNATLRHANLGCSALGGTVPAGGAWSGRKTAAIAAAMAKAIAAVEANAPTDGPHKFRAQGHVAKLRAILAAFEAA